VYAKGFGVGETVVTTITRRGDAGLGEEQGNRAASRRHDITVRAWQTMNEPLEAEPAQIVLICEEV